MANSDFHGHGLIIMGWNKGEFRNARYESVLVTNDRPFPEAFELAKAIRGKLHFKEGYEFTKIYWALQLDYNPETKEIEGPPEEVIDLALSYRQAA